MSKAAPIPQSRGRHEILTQWFAVHTKPQRERVTADNLIRAGFRAFAPYRLCEVRHARTTIIKRRPVFVRYVFVGAVGGRSIQDAKRVACVSSVVAFGDGDPVPIPARIIDRLMERCDADGLMVVHNDRHPEPRWKPGDYAKIMDDSPLSGLVAQITGIDGAGFLEVETDLFRAARKVKVAANRVEPIEAVSP